MFLIVLALPRLAIVCLWFFTGWFSPVFDWWLWPLLGVLFMPHTILWYSAVQNWFHGQWDILQIIVLVFAVALDLSAATGAKKGRK